MEVPAWYAADVGQRRGANCRDESAELLLHYDDGYDGWTDMGAVRWRPTQTPRPATVAERKPMRTCGSGGGLQGDSSGSEFSSTDEEAEAYADKIRQRGNDRGARARARSCRPSNQRTDAKSVDSSVGSEEESDGEMSAASSEDASSSGSSSDDWRPRRGTKRNRNSEGSDTGGRKGRASGLAHTPPRSDEDAYSILW